MSKRLQHAAAERVRRLDEPIRTAAAALIGLVMAGMVAVAANLLTIGLAGDGLLRDQTTNGVVVLLFGFLWTAVSVVMGAYVAVRLHSTWITLSTFIVLEILLGVGLAVEFWQPGGSWIDALALLFLVPFAVLGGSLARPGALKWTARPII